MKKYKPLQVWYEEIEDIMTGDSLSADIANLPHQQLADCMAFLSGKLDMLEGRPPPLDPTDPIDPIEPPVVPPPYVPPPYVPAAVRMFEVSAATPQSFSTGATPTIIGRNPDYKNQGITWGCHVDGYDAAGKVIYLGVHQRGAGVTDATGRVIFTVSALPSPAALSAKIVTLSYGIFVSGIDYDHNRNSAAIKVDNGATVPAGVAAARGIPATETPHLK